MTIVYGLFLWLFGTLGVAQGLEGKRDAVMTVGAAASLDPVLTQVKDAFMQTQVGKDVAIHISYQGSDDIYRGVMAGAPYDVIFLAQSDLVLKLKEQGKIQEGAFGTVVRNRLVLVAREEASFAGKKIALCLASVPCGQYGDQWLGKLSQLSSLSIVRAPHAKATLLMLDRGLVDYAIVYKTDIRGTAFKVLQEAPAEVADPKYAAGLCRGKEGREIPFGRDFYDFLYSDQAKAIYKQAGFLEP